MDKKIGSLGTILFLFLAPLVLFLPVFMQWKGIFHNDQAMSEWIRHYFFAQNLQKGVFPLWDPYVWCGAMIHYAFIYSGENYYFLLWPFIYLSNLHSLDNAYWMLCLLPLFLHYFIAIAGMFFLLKKVVKCNWIASFVGAFTYMYSPAFVYSYVSQDNLIMQAWLPWLLFIYVESVKKFTFLKLFLGALVLAFIWFGGKLAYIPFIMVIWAGFILLAIFQKYGVKEKYIFWKPLGIAASMLILGTTLSAVYLLSLLEGAKFTKLHLDLTYANAVSFKAGNMPLSYLVTLFLPDFFGNITGQDYIFNNLQFWWTNMSAGMATTFIVFLGALAPIVLFAKARQNKHYLQYAFLGTCLYLFAVLCAMGGNTPFYRLLIGWIPVVNVLPYPIRYRMIQCFATSLLIAVVLHMFTSFDLTAAKFRLRKLSTAYVLISFLAIIAVLFSFQKREDHAPWLNGLDINVKNFLPLHSPVGMYTSKTARTKKMRLLFDGPSQGEIRYADTNKTLLSQGRLVKNYAVSIKGWAQFDVDIPPNKFLWILPLSGEGRIGYWKEDDHSFLFENGWHINPCVRTINLYNESYQGKPALVYRLISGHVEIRPVVFSLLYWIVLSLFIIIAVRVISIKQFVYAVAIFVVLEFSYFGTQAFYGCTFNEFETNARTFLPHNVRSIMPSKHPMYKDMLSRIFPITDATMRIATDYPFYENFTYVDNRFALTGEPSHPLEKRFKRAVEAAYRHRMDESMIFEGGGNLPFSQHFLSNFSVKYFISRSSEQLFDRWQCVPVEGEPKMYIHVNPRALPRAYTINTFMFKSEEGEFNGLLFDDLSEVVYTSLDGTGVSFIREHEETPHSFKELQIKNPIQKLEFPNPNEVKIDIAITVPSMLVLTDVWFPGWKAFDGGRPIAIYRVNYCQRGMWLEKGFHRIWLRFQPSAWWIGLMISMSVAFCMIVFLVKSLIKNNE